MAAPDTGEPSLSDYRAWQVRPSCTKLMKHRDGVVAPSHRSHSFVSCRARSAPRRNVLAITAKTLREHDRIRDDPSVHARRVRVLLCERHVSQAVRIADNYKCDRCGDCGGRMRDSIPCRLAATLAHSSRACARCQARCADRGWRATIAAVPIAPRDDRAIDRDRLCRVPDAAGGSRRTADARRRRGGHGATCASSIECRQSLDAQIATLGHELQHAVEVAEEGAIVDQRSLQALYGRIGFATEDRRRQFESHAAREAGDQVRRDLSSRASRSPGADGKQAETRGSTQRPQSTRDSSTTWRLHRHLGCVIFLEKPLMTV